MRDRRKVPFRDPCYVFYEGYYKMGLLFTVLEGLRRLGARVAGLRVLGSKVLGS